MPLRRADYFVLVLKMVVVLQPTCSCDFETDLIIPDFTYIIMLTLVIVVIPTIILCMFLVVPFCFFFDFLGE